MAITVMSQNVMCWEKEPYALFVNRRPLMKKAVLESGADLVGFQEVTPKWEKWFKEDLEGFEGYVIYRGAKESEGTPIYWKKDRLKKRTAVISGCLRPRKPSQWAGMHVVCELPAGYCFTIKKTAKSLCL